MFSYLLRLRNGEYGIRTYVLIKFQACGSAQNNTYVIKPTISMFNNHIWN